MPTHPSDLETLIINDHRLAELLLQRLTTDTGNSEILRQQIVYFVASHSSAEETLIYPMMRSALGDDQAVDYAENEHLEIKEMLRTLEDMNADTEIVRKAALTLMDELQHHTRIEEATHIPRFRQAVGDLQMQELGHKFLTAQLTAPTHAHENVTESRLKSLLEGAVDTIKDKASGRDHAIATDASCLLNMYSQAIVDRHASMGTLPIHLLSPEIARRQPSFADAAQSLLAERGDPEPEAVSSVEDHQITGPDGNALNLRIYRPAAAAPQDVLPITIYVHGGGWVLGDLDTYDPSARAICNAGQTMVFSLDYRNAPEAKFPNAHHDISHATRWVIENASRFYGDPNLFAIAGESAGANMAIATTFELFDNDGTQPIAQILIQPVTSTAMNTRSYAECLDARPLYSAMMNWFFTHLIDNADQLADPRLNTLARGDEKLATLPPTLIITGERDPLRDEGEELADRIHNAGARVALRRHNGVPHEFFGFGKLIPEARQAQILVGNTLQKAFAANAD